MYLFAPWCLYISRSTAGGLDQKASPSLCSLTSSIKLKCATYYCNMYRSVLGRDQRTRRVSYISEACGVHVDCDAVMQRHHLLPFSIQDSLMLSRIVI